MLFCGTATQWQGSLTGERQEGKCFRKGAGPVRKQVSCWAGGRSRAKTLAPIKDVYFIVKTVKWFLKEWIVSDLRKLKIAWWREGRRGMNVPVLKITSWYLRIISSVEWNTHIISQDGIQTIMLSKYCIFIYNLGRYFERFLHINLCSMGNLHIVCFASPHMVMKYECNSLQKTSESKAILKELRAHVEMMPFDFRKPPLILETVQCLLEKRGAVIILQWVGNHTKCYFSISTACFQKWVLEKWNVVFSSAN